MPAVQPDYSDLPFKAWYCNIIGAAHLSNLGNCQDAVKLRECNYLRPRTPIAQGRALVAAVSDGVGSNRYSEVGARVTVAAATNLAMDGLLKGERPAAIEARLNKYLPRHLGQLADLCRDDWTECCYATLVLVVATRDWFVIWGCGDGFWSVNGGRPAATGVTLKDRLPVDYVNPPEDGKARPSMLTRLVELKTSEVRGAWISTDGARYLTENGKAWTEYQSRELVDAPPVLEGWQAMESWGQALYESARVGESRLRDDLGLVALVPREES